MTIPSYGDVPYDSPLRRITAPPSIPSDSPLCGPPLHLNTPLRQLTLRDDRVLRPEEKDDLYVLRADPDWIKVGRSGDPCFRKTTLQYGCPLLLTTIVTQSRVGYLEQFLIRYLISHGAILGNTKVAGLGREWLIIEHTKAEYLVSYFLSDTG